MQALTEEWEGRPGISVYFDLQVDQSAVDAVVLQLERDTRVDNLQLTSAEDALNEFKAYSGIDDALDLLESNPLPTSLQASFADNVGSDEVEALTARIADSDGVADVVVEKTWLERLNDLSAIVERLGLVLALLFGVGAVLVTASSVRLAIEARLEELRVLMLVGATAGQIRRPFLYFGAIYGFGGAVLGAMLIAVTVAVIEPPLQSLLGSYQQTLQLVGFDPNFLTALLIVGAALGILGAMLAVRQRLADLELL